MRNATRKASRLEWDISGGREKLAVKGNVLIRGCGSVVECTSVGVDRVRESLSVDFEAAKLIFVESKKLAGAWLGDTSYKRGISVVWLFFQCRVSRMRPGWPFVKLNDDKGLLE